MRHFVLLFALLSLFACAKKARPRAPQTPAASVARAGDRQRGLASWYGEPYHGRAAANGEIYDMHRLTAAHRTLPFDTLARVTHERSHRSVDVRIIDRGPFIDGRIIDLSREAARRIGLLEEGVAPVELTVLALPAARFAVQAGAFREAERALRRRDELARLYPDVRVLAPDRSSDLHRVVLGAFPRREDAAALARELAAREHDSRAAHVIEFGSP